jgi:hypothetical protein
MAVKLSKITTSVLLYQIDVWLHIPVFLLGILTRILKSNLCLVMDCSNVTQMIVNLQVVMRVNQHNRKFLLDFNVASL